MRIQKIDGINQTFGHTSGDYYIETGRMLSVGKVKKKIFNFDYPWYKKLLYLLKNVINFVTKK